MASNANIGKFTGRMSKEIRKMVQNGRGNYSTESNNGFNISRGGNLRVDGAWHTMAAGRMATGGGLRRSGIKNAQDFVVSNVPKKKQPAAQRRAVNRAVSRAQATATRRRRAAAA